ncbi:hypothetical protein PPL_07933 [Heterostelium album PN500]|uniref:DUF7906 domain-containing protein n=1 Tax=Heterostelium pallidum (strain ATCC 26659 / Pp 5 / PN500) TaxID=670386 RepID=D3BHD1_HETP5|nr:hypothetical protein PPL_07933 [Heterostelium album PN500]EFA79108.1 hypothetical protein PPL_07933 [Heterostelium album PN500]|eukprot:XP_020431230.1 hypothetical protein PPL_07933 [Heterostelium album PN500]
MYIYNKISVYRSSSSTYVVIAQHDHDDDDHVHSKSDTFTSTFAFEHPININYSTIPFIKQKYLYFVSTASIQLKDNIQNAIKNGLAKREVIHPSMAITTLPYVTVDKLVWNDYVTEKSNAYTIYIINSDLGERYTYSQLPIITHADNRTLLCTTKVWQSMAPNLKASSSTGAAQGEGRYMWIDLGADTPSYGPLTKGTGSILPDTLPNRRTGSNTNEFLYNIATFIHHSTRQLITPVVSHASNYHWTELEVRLIMVHDHQVGMIEQSENFDWPAIQGELSRIKRLPHQSITFSKAEISLLDNVHAAQAKQSSLRVHHSGTKGTQQYLDSKELHYWLKQHNLQFVPELDYRNNRLIIPVFLFDISFKDLLLLDRTHQAVSFNDMVIAIQTQSQRISDFKCDQILQIDATDATRPVLASLLETIWGISPTQLSLAKNSDTPDFNYIWSLGFNPFSIFSPHKSISFSQADAAIRNIVYFNIVDSLVYLQAVYQHIDDDETWEEFSKSNPGIQSIYQLKQKIHEILHEVGQDLSNHQEAEAFEKVNSLQSLIQQLTETIYINHKTRHSFLDCQQSSIVWSELISVGITVSLALILAQKVLKNKYSF